MLTQIGKKPIGSKSNSTTDTSTTIGNSRHRVVVQLTNIEKDDDGDSFPTIVVTPSTISGSAGAYGTLAHIKKFPQRNINARVEILSQNTLRLSAVDINNIDGNVRNHLQLHFDCVGNMNDMHIHAELMSIFNHLFVQHHNCCLIRFTAQRECQLQFLCNLLVRDLDNRIHQLNGKLHVIKLSYYDVRKYDVVNLLGQANGISGVARRKQYLRPRHQFTSTMELYKWLKAKYVQLWADGSGHECFDFHFIFSNGRRRMHSVKFSLMQLYLNKMDGDTRMSLRRFFLSINSGRRAKNTMLTDCLKEYFNGEELWHTWMIFEVSLLTNEGVMTDIILKLARAAYAGLNNVTPKRKKEVTVGLSLKSNGSLSDCKLNKITPNSSVCDIANHVTVSEAKMSDTNHNSNTKLTFLPSMEFSSKDLNSLSYWYTRIDDKFYNVITAMDAYFDHKYDTQLGKMCNDIKDMMRTVIQQDQEARGEEVNSAETNESDEYYMEHYKTAMTEFRHLLHEIETSHYTELLKVYLKTKSYELQQHALHFKVQQLETFQTRLTGTIKNEVSALREVKPSAGIRQETTKDPSIAVGEEIVHKRKLKT